jgi:hypothetical protein
VNKKKKGADDEVSTGLESVDESAAPGEGSGERWTDDELKAASGTSAPLR